MKIKDFKNTRARFLFPAFAIGLLILPYLATGQTRNGLSPAELKKLSLEELFSLEVTSVSKRPEKLIKAPSAIQVITGDDIHRSAATNVPDALRLTPNLQVAQLNSYAWIISARGFNALFANKLLVMIDGRAVYTPLFAGVFWDAQNVLMEDIEQIEVISGPGATLWGANAVNGVINIKSKSAESTQGLYVSGTAGTFLKNSLAARYGGKLGDNIHYRVYAQHFNRNHTSIPDSIDVADEWGMTQGGFRLDWEPSERDLVTIQGGLYGGAEKNDTVNTTLDGQNVIARWQHTFSQESGMILKAYFDRTWRRDIPSTISNELQTYDIDFQHNFTLGQSHNMLWGLGYRLMRDKTLNSTIFAGFIPQERNLQLFSGFVQDEITLTDDLTFTLGTKVLHNDYTGFEWQPSGRLAWRPGAWQTVWAAVSRAVRTPSRIDADYYIPAYDVPPDQPSVAGGPNFESEKVIAYEAGYRAQPFSALSLSLAIFYNKYNDLYSVEALPGTLTYQIQNGSEGRTWGLELSGTYQLAAWWRLRGGYTYFRKDIGPKPGHIFDTSIFGNDAHNIALFQSIADLPENFELDVTLRFVDELPQPYVPAYFTFDARLAWEYKDLELAVVGQNLFERWHSEWQGERGPEIPRSVYGKIVWRYQK